MLRRLPLPGFGKLLWAAAALLCLAALARPPAWFANRLQQPQGLERLLLFGQHFEERTLPEVKRLAPPRDSVYGYDAQFYSQLAYDPMLLNPNLEQALDNAAYRGRRIALPALAWLATPFHPELRLKAFAWINPLCWTALVLTLAWATRLRTWRDWLCLAACSLGSGVLYSAQRSLTDLPSALFTLWAALAAGTGAAAFLALAILSKETAVFSLPLLLRASSPAKETTPSWWQRLRLPILALLPVLLWWAYLSWTFGLRHAGGQGNFAAPFSTFFQVLGQGFHAHASHPGFLTFVDLMTPVSLALQAAYLGFAWKKNAASPLWRMGIGFAFLLLLLGPAPWAELSVACRVLLPLTLSFNLLLREESSHPAFLAWFVFGNTGLLAEWMRMAA